MRIADWKAVVLFFNPQSEIRIPQFYILSTLG
jgi:hypothetical protein